MYIEMFFYQTACLLHCITRVDKNACNKYHIDFMHWCSNPSEFSLPLSLKFWVFSVPLLFPVPYLCFSPAPPLPTLLFSFLSLTQFVFLCDKLSKSPPESRQQTGWEHHHKALHVELCGVECEHEQSSCYK